MLNEIVLFFTIAAARRHLWFGIYPHEEGTVYTMANYKLAMDVAYDEHGNSRLVADHRDWVVTPVKSMQFPRV
jgi:hypothetical protein